MTRGDMKTATFYQLRKLRQQYGPGIFGKITQKLLAIAFYNAGFHHFTERGVQGADIDVANPAGEKYALEVKTTDSNAVPLSKENIDALAGRTSDGYVPMIAALRLQMFEDWILADVPLSQLRPGVIPLSRLRGYRVARLEERICPAFEEVVSEHFAAVLSGGERYLLRVLDGKRAAPAQHAGDISGFR